MAVNFGGIFGGLAKGLSEGIPQGVQLAQKQEQIDLQRSEAKLRAFQTIKDLSGWDEEMLKTAGPAFFKTFGKIVGADIPPEMVAAYVKGSGEQRDAIRKVWIDAISTGKVDPQNIAAALKGISPDKMAEIGSSISAIKRGEATTVETKRHNIATEGLTSRGLDEAAAERKDRRVDRADTAAATANRDILDNASKNFTGPGVTEFEKQLSENQAYAAAKLRGDSSTMYAIAAKIRQGIAKTNPDFYSTKGTTDLGVATEMVAKYKPLAEAETDPAKKQKYQELVDRYERIIKFGGKEIPDAHVKFLESANTATRWAAKAATILGDSSKGNVLSFKDRAELGQAVQGLKLEMARFLERGANFTDSEQKMIDSVMGGNPNDIISRSLRNREDFIERLRTVHQMVRDKVAGREKALIGGQSSIEQFPERGLSAKDKSDAKSADEVANELKRAEQGPKFIQGTGPNSPDQPTLPNGVGIRRSGTDKKTGKRVFEGTDGRLYDSQGRPL